MNRNVFLALFAGLFGGLITHFVTPAAVFAQNQSRVPQEIRAQAFVLVDPLNRPAGTFTAEGMRIVLRDSKGHEIWSAGGSGLQPLTNLK